MYFKSEESETIFYLLELDGSIRMKKLKITRMLFSSKKASKVWYDEKFNLINNSNHSLKVEALNKLKELYNDMLGN